jgi:hypothetical protein
MSEDSAITTAVSTHHVIAMALTVFDVEITH